MKTILGIDEVGRGPWAGPLVIGAVVLGPHRPEWDNLTDSKKLTTKKREELNRVILEQAAATGLGWVSAAEIDRYGLARSLKLACQRAVKAVFQAKTPFDEIIIDGTVNFLANTPLSDRVTVLKKADFLVREVSAASIIAKVARDHYMVELAQKYPAYGFERHVGYGTALHRQALALHGPCPEHRKSFRPIHDLLDSHAETTTDPFPSEDFELDTGTIDTHTASATGQSAENVVLCHLRSLGHCIVAHNYKTPACEIDLISTYDGSIYFTEVKYRRATTRGTPLDRIDATKQAQMRFAADTFLSVHPEYVDYQPLLAVAAVAGPDFRLRNWFTIGE